jgi:hypothetical protein
MEWWGDEVQMEVETDDRCLCGMEVETDEGWERDQIFTAPARDQIFTGLKICSPIF